MLAAMLHFCCCLSYTPGMPIDNVFAFVDLITYMHVYDTHVITHSAHKFVISRTLVTR